MTKSGVWFYTEELQKIKLADGTELAYSDNGSGAKTLLFIHGLSANSLSWLKNIEVLSKHCRCVAVDLPGNGQSPDYATDKLTLKRYAHTLLHFIGQLGLSNVTLVGHSMGAQVALHMALEVPQAISSLVLLAPAGLETFSVWEIAMAQNSFFWMDLLQPAENTMAQFYEMAFHRMPQESKKLLDFCTQDARRHGDSRYQATLMSCISSMFTQTVASRLPEIKMPVHILFGEADALIPNRLLHPRLSPLSLAKDACRQLPQGSYEILKRAGHFLQWEAADEVNTSIRNFLEKTS